MTPSPPSTRKRPHCHSCGLPMAGHKRHDRLTICPTNSNPPPSLASPPPTPPRQRSPKRSSSPHGHSGGRIPIEPSFVIPESGPWHRRNPNWVDSPVIAPRPPSPVSSLVSTVLVGEDGKTIKGSNDDDVDISRESDNYAYSSSGFLHHAADTSQRVVSVIGTTPEDAPRVQEAATKRGVHAGLIHLPVNKVKAGSKSLGKREHSWWMIVGRDADVVNYIVDSQQKNMPGAQDIVMEGPRMVTFLHLVLAGVIGGWVAVYGLSFL